MFRDVQAEGFVALEAAAACAQLRADACVGSRTRGAFTHAHAARGSAERAQRLRVRARVRQQAARRHRGAGVRTLKPVSGQRHSVIGTPPADSKETSSSGFGAAMGLVRRALKKRLSPKSGGGDSNDAAATKTSSHSSGAQRSADGGRVTRRQARAGAVTRAGRRRGAAARTGHRSVPIVPMDGRGASNGGGTYGGRATTR
jgi:hypothetical protein